jgi:hypothetical protein
MTIAHLHAAQAQVHYGPLYPVGSTFDVIIQRDSVYSQGEEHDTAWLVVYPVPNNLTTWKCINCNGIASHSVWGALESLLVVLQGGEECGECELALVIFIIARQLISL